LILDLPAQEGLSRAKSRRSPEETIDRFEGEGARFHEALRGAFLAIAAADPGRCVVIDASPPEQEVAEAIGRVVSKRLIASAALDEDHGA
jgi:dTMP kinase